MGTARASNLRLFGRQRHDVPAALRRVDLDLKQASVNVVRFIPSSDATAHVYWFWAVQRSSARICRLVSPISGGTASSKRPALHMKAQTRIADLVCLKGWLGNAYNAYYSKIILISTHLAKKPGEGRKIAFEIEQVNS